MVVGFEGVHSHVGKNLRDALCVKMSKINVGRFRSVGGAERRVGGGPGDRGGEGGGGWGGGGGV